MDEERRVRSPNPISSYQTRTLTPIGVISIEKIMKRIIEERLLVDTPVNCGDTTSNESGSPSVSSLSWQQSKWKQLFIDYFLTDNECRIRKNSWASSTPRYSLTDMEDVMSTKSLMIDTKSESSSIETRGTKRWGTRGGALPSVFYFVKHLEPSDKKMEDNSPKLVVKSRENFKITDIDETEVSWKETLYLNLICSLSGKMKIAIGDNVLDYMADSAIVLGNSWIERVQPSPCIGDPLDAQGAYIITYPFVCFSVVDYETKLANVTLSSNQYFCVELSVCLPSEDSVVKERLVSVFLGAVDFNVLLERYVLAMADFTKQNYVQQLKAIKRRPLKFIDMYGPKRKGTAQVAVSGKSSSNQEDNPTLPNEIHSKQITSAKQNLSLLWKAFKLMWKVTDDEAPDRLYIYVKHIMVPWMGIMEDLERFLESSKFSSAFITT
jgi:hypothetical protein